MKPIIHISEKIRNKYLESKFSRDTIWLVLAQIILMGAGLAMNLIIGKNEGAVSLGVFNQSIAYYTILSTLFAFGLNNTLVKKISESKLENKLEARLFTSNIVCTFFISGILSLIVIILTLKFPFLYSSSKLAEVVFIPFLALPFFNVNKNFMAYYSGKRNQKHFAIERIIRWGGILVFICFFSFQGFGIDILLYAFFVSEAFLFIFNINSLFKKFDFSFSKSDIKENLSFGMKSYVSEIISVFNSSLDLVLIGYFLSNSEVGIYSFIIFFVKTLYIFPGILMQNLNPIISNLWSNNQINLLKKKVSEVKKVNLMILIAQLLFLLVFFKIITVYIKQEFATSYIYFLVSIGGVFIYSLISWSGSMLVMTGKLRENNLRTSLIAVLSLISITFFCYNFGLMGACIAVCFNGLMAFSLTSRFLYKIIGIKVI